MADHPAINLLIAGETLGADGRDTAEVIDPATGETVGQVPHATAADLDRALEAAQRGFKTWRGMSPDQRTAILLKAAALIRERAPAIGEALTREQGKPLKEAIGETIYSAMLLEFYAQEIKRIYGRTLVRPAGSRVEVQYHPVGPVAGFAAWNFPSLNVMRKIGGALAATAGAYLGTRALARRNGKDGKVKGSVEIGQPEEFWSASKYLILVQD